MSFEQHIKQKLEKIRKFLKRKGDLLPFQLQSLIASEMEIAGVSSDWKKGIKGAEAFPKKTATWRDKGSVKLRGKSGQLLQSFLPRRKNSLTKVELNGLRLEVDFGTKLPYAGVHEYGGFIKHKGNMPGWFYAQYKDTKNKFYLVMYLSSKKLGGVNIPARPYFNPAIEKLKTGEFNKWADEVRNELLGLISG